MDMQTWETDFTDEITCPYCGYEYEQSFEFGDYDDEVLCESCNKTFSMARYERVSYSTEKTEENNT